VDDRPTALELIRAVADFLERDLLPAITDRRLRYEILIAANTLRIAGRELPGEGERLRAELGALADLLDLPREAPPESLEQLRARALEANRQLCERIRGGRADEGPWRERVLAHMAAAVDAKLRVTNPRELEPRGGEGGTG
jgi:hypothetical protein